MTGIGRIGSRIVVDDVPGRLVELVLPQGMPGSVIPFCPEWPGLFGSGTPLTEYDRALDLRDLFSDTVEWIETLGGDDVR